MDHMALSALNRNYGIPNQLGFKEGPGGLVVAEIKNPHGEATVALHGGQILAFRPRGHEEVLWLSRASDFETGHPIRGGIPVCWPWFADHPTDNTKPAHGFVRTAVWSVSASEALADQSTRLELSIADSAQTMKLWPHSFRLAIDVTLSDVLRVKLTATNTGAAAFECSGALHSYFSISSPSQITIKGLAGCDYLDKVDRFRRKVQQGDIAIASETERIYLDTTAVCIIEDHGLRRQIGIAKNGSHTTVVWNPWIDKARAMKDFGDDEYMRMVCVETANAATDTISLAPGSTHILEGVIRPATLVRRDIDQGA